jgi:hypothetical protein
MSLISLAIALSRTLMVGSLFPNHLWAPAGHRYGPQFDLFCPVVRAFGPPTRKPNNSDRRVALFAIGVNCSYPSDTACVRGLNCTCSWPPLLSS